MPTTIVTLTRHADVGAVLTDPRFRRTASPGGWPGTRRRLAARKRRPVQHGARRTGLASSRWATATV